MHFEVGHYHCPLMNDVCLKQWRAAARGFRAITSAFVKQERLLTPELRKLLLFKLRTWTSPTGLRG